MTAPVFHCLGFTPNAVTTLTIFIRLLSAHFILKNKKTEAIILLLIGLWTDSLDGYMARKYNMTSEFGHFYDRIADYITGFIYMVVILRQFMKSNIQHKYIYVLLSLLFLICSFEKISCREKDKKQTDKAMNQFYSSQICPTNKPDHQTLKDRIDLFGVPSLTLFMAFVIYKL